jgi:hypothetical protein
MPLYRATALIAVLLIVLLSAGYAAAERDAADTGTNSGPGPRIVHELRP